MARKRKVPLLLAAVFVVAMSAAVAQAAGAGGRGTHRRVHIRATWAATATPIKHLVVIFQENVSFDHYFGTYPHATNPRVSRRSTPHLEPRRSTGSRVRC